MVEFSVDAALDGDTNMARDIALLERAEEGEAGCRVYGWDGPWVSLGKQQDPQSDLIDLNLVPWVIRPTGGRAVLHGHDVTIGLAVPMTTISALIGVPTTTLCRSVKTVYRFIAAPLVAALNDCGHRVALAEETSFSGRGPDNVDCFAHVSPNDIVDLQTGMKACGCALRLTHSAVLVQASIPNGKPLVDPGRLFRGAQVLVGRKWDSNGFAAALRSSLLLIQRPHSVGADRIES